MPKVAADIAALGDSIDVLISAAIIDNSWSNYLLYSVEQKNPSEV